MIPEDEAKKKCGSAKGGASNKDNLTIVLRSCAVPGSTEQADAWVLEAAGCEMSDKYWAVAGRSSDQEITNKRMTRSRGKNTCEALEIAAAIPLHALRRSEELRFSKASASVGLYRCRMTAKRT